MYTLEIPSVPKTQCIINKNSLILAAFSIQYWHVTDTHIQAVTWWQHRVAKCKDVRTSATFCHTMPIRQCFSSSCFITHVNKQYNTDLQVCSLLLFHLLLLLHLQYSKLSFNIYHQQSNRLIVSKWNKNRPSSYKLKSRSVDNIHHLFTRTD